MWTPTALRSEFRRLGGTIWRVVESQYQASTMKLVDTEDEQAALEELLDAQAKPSVPPDAVHLHYLLKSPLRYKPATPYGSRFRASGPGPGVFYAAECIPTALAEFGHHRLKFFNASPDASLPRNPMPVTVFSAEYATHRGLDLTLPELARDRDIWTSPDDYSGTQALAAMARIVHVEAIRSESVRDPERRTNVSLLSPTAFAATDPTGEQSWKLHLTRDAARFRRDLLLQDETYTFTRADLGVGA